jgi:hypothetical protein
MSADEILIVLQKLYKQRSDLDSKIQAAEMALVVATAGVAKPANAIKAKKTATRTIAEKNREAREKGICL